MLAHLSCPYPSPYPSPKPARGPTAEKVGGGVSSRGLAAAAPPGCDGGSVGACAGPFSDGLGTDLGSGVKKRSISGVSRQRVGDGEAAARRGCLVSTKARLWPRLSWLAYPV